MFNNDIIFYIYNIKYYFIIFCDKIEIYKAAKLAN